MSHQIFESFKFTTVTRACELIMLNQNVIYSGSYMSDHVLLNLLNKLGKRGKMHGLPSILFLFRNRFNKFNYTRA